MADTSRRLSRYLQTPLRADRIDDNWAAIARALPATQRTQRRAPLLLAAGFAALVAVAVYVRGSWAPSTAAIDGAVLETGVGETQVLSLADGSRIVLGPETRLRLVRVSGRDVRLEVERGGIDTQAAHVDGRTFSVLAGGIEIGVVGTQFSVQKDVDAAEVRVSVEEGRVRILRTGGDTTPRYLSAGESWVASLAHDTPHPTTLPVGAAAHPSPSAPAAASTRPAPKPRLPARFHELYSAGRYGDAYNAVGTEQFGKLVDHLGPRELFELAEVARLSGHPRQAADAFDALRSRHREDQRAGLAALELGRLLLDELDDPKSAADALEDSLRVQPDGFYREDAESRRIQALEAAGRSAECAAAREQYLLTYPNGVHAANVARRCR